MDQRNLLDHMIEFNETSRPRKKEVKEKEYF